MAGTVSNLEKQGDQRRLKIVLSLSPLLSFEMRATRRRYSQNEAEFQIFTPPPPCTNYGRDGRMSASHFQVELHRVQKKSNIFIFTIYFSQFLDEFYETFSEYP